MRLLEANFRQLDDYPVSVLTGNYLADSPRTRRVLEHVESMPADRYALINVGLASSRIEAIGIAKGFFGPNQSGALTINSVYLDGEPHNISSSVTKTSEGALVSATVSLYKGNVDGQPNEPLGEAIILYGKNDNPQGLIMKDGTGIPMTDIERQRKLAARMSNVAAELSDASVDVPSEDVHEKTSSVGGYIDIFESEENEASTVEGVTRTSIDAPTLGHIQKASAMIKRVGIDNGLFGKDDSTTVVIDHLPRGKKSYQLIGAFTRGKEGKIDNVEITVSEEKEDGNTSFGKARLEYATTTACTPEKLFIEDHEGNVVTKPKDTRRISTLMENVASKINHDSFD